ncbi:MAG: AI-2E family transporter [Verrucomicrobia bacterium]|nr:AI-2E family transporter [Verrucomicrobiota bacterium]
MGFPAPTEKQARILWVAVTAFAIGILLALVGLLCWGVGWVINRLSSVLLPLAVAGIVAYLLDPLVDFFAKRGMPRGRAILWVFFLAIVLVIGVLATIVPRVVVETNGLIKSLPGYINKMRPKVEAFIKNPPLGIQLPSFLGFSFGRTNDLRSSTNVAASVRSPSTNAVPALAAKASGDTNALPQSPDGTAQAPVWETDLGEKLLRWTPGALLGIGNWILDQLSKVASWAGLLIGLSLVPVYAFYFLLEKRGIERKWTDYLPIHESWVKDELVFVLKSINYYLILFFRGQVLVAFCDGVLYTIGFLLIGLNYAFLLGLVAGVLSIVPFLGFVISVVPALALAAVQHGDWLHPVLVLAVFTTVQSLEGLFISPKIMGDRVGLHPLTIIIAVMVGTTLMGGIIGGILAIPLTAALRVLMFRYVWKRPGPA